jgi:hypothetical protein
MAPVLPQREPCVATAGDTWEWTRSFTDFPVSEGWDLSYAFVSRTGEQAPLTWDDAWVTDDGQQWTVSIPAAITKDLDAGGYAWQAFVTLAGKRHTAGSGTTLVASDLATADSTSELKHAAEQLLAVRAEIKARLDGTGSGIETYQLGPRALGLIPFKDLVDYEAKLATKVNRLTNPGTFGRDIRSRYRRASSGSRD